MGARKASGLAAARQDSGAARQAVGAQNPATRAKGQIVARVQRALHLGADCVAGDSGTRKALGEGRNDLASFTLSPCDWPGGDSGTRAWRDQWHADDSIAGVADVG